VARVTHSRNHFSFESRPTSPDVSSSQQSISCLSPNKRSATISAIETMPSRSLQRNIFRALLLSAAAIFCVCASAQTLSRPSGTPLPDPNQNGSNKDEKDVNFGSPENEMRAKYEIKEEKKKYDEHLARAREVSQIATQLSEGYEKHRSFGSDDGKRLERLEKLTKRIRNDAGGSENDADADVKDIPPDLQSLIKRVAEVADELQKMVEKPPRNVVSAAVIDQANRLLSLVQHLRGVSR